MPEHTILGGKVNLYRRGDGDNWQCSTYLRGKNRRKSTKEESLALAKEVAEDWYLDLRGQSRAGLLTKEEKFSVAAEIFLKEYSAINAGHRSPDWIKGHEIRLRLHLIPYFGDMNLPDIIGGTVQQYLVHRMTNLAPNPLSKSKHKPKEKPPSQSTLHDETVTLRMVLKSAVRRGKLEHIPDLSPAYRKNSKISHRPWFSREEYKQLYKATGENIRQVKDQDRWDAEQLHDYVLFMANTGLRPDEAMARNLEHRDVKMVKDKETGELILEIEIRGKRGVGYCKSMPNAVKPYQRLLNRPKWEAQGRQPRSAKARALAAATPQKSVRLPQPTDPLFPSNHIRMFNVILNRTGLKLDRAGKRRTAGSLRHTYICLRLSEGADIYQIAKNCRTSVEMIQKFYAAHIKDILDAGAINKRKPRTRHDTGDHARTD